MKVRIICIAALMSLLLCIGSSIQQFERSDLIVSDGVKGGFKSVTVPSSTGQTIWNKTFSTPDSEFPFEILKAHDGGFYVLYLDYEPSSVFGNATLMRLDSNGIPIWNRSISEGHLQSFPSMTSTQDGGFTIISSYENGTTGDASTYMVHLDAEGDQVWNNTIHGEVADYSVQIIEVTNGDYFFVSHHQHNVDTSWFTASMIVRTDSTGNLIWNRVYTPGWVTMSVDLVEAVSGDLVILTKIQDRFSSNEDFWIYSVDENGDHVWNYTFDQREYDDPYDIEVSNFGGYIIGGNIRDGGSLDAVLLHLNETGNPTWNETYSLDHITTLSDLVVSADGAITFIGTIYTESIDEQVCLAKTNSTGGILWNSTYRPVDNIYGQCLVEISPDVYTLGAAIDIDPGPSGHYDFWIAKVARPMSGLTSVNQDHQVGTFFNYDLDAESVLGLDTWWLNDTTNFLINVDGLIQNATIIPGGVYGLQVSVNDTAGRFLTTSFTVTAIDTDTPTWRVPLSDQYAEYGVPFMYDIDALDPSGISAYWLDNPSFTVDTFGVIQNATFLMLGDYPIMISVNDTVGNEVSVEITIMVRDTTNPLPDDLLDFDYEVGDPGFWLNWSCIELLPDIFELDLEGEIQMEGNWNGSDVSYFVEPLELGTYRYTLLFADTSGNIGTDTVVVSAVDTTAPTVDSPLDMWYIEGIGGGFIEWHPDDLHPYTYVIFLNSVQVQSGGWSDTSVTIPAGNLLPGLHNYTVVVFDTSGNFVTDTVLVTVEALLVSSTTSTTTQTTSTAISTTTTTTSTTPTTTTNQTNFLFTINNLYGQIGALTIGLIIVGSISVVSIVLVIYSIRKLRE